MINILHTAVNEFCCFARHFCLTFYGKQEERLFDSLFICFHFRYAGRLKAKKRDMVVESEFHHKEKVNNCSNIKFLQYFFAYSSVRRSKLQLSLNMILGDFQFNSFLSVRNDFALLSLPLQPLRQQTRTRL